MMPNVSGLRGTQPWFTTDSRGTSVSQWIEACLTPCLTFGRVYNRLEQVWEQRDPLSIGEYDCCNFKCWACCIFCPCWSCFMARQRTRIRKVYDIAGSFQDDCWYSCCRPCCVLIQEERELMSRAERAGQKSDADGDAESEDLYEKPYQPSAVPRAHLGPAGSQRRTSHPVTGQPAQHFMTANAPILANTPVDMTPVANELVAQAHNIICGAHLQLTQLERRMSATVPTVQLNGTFPLPSLPLGDRCPRCSRATLQGAFCNECIAMSNRHGRDGDAAAHALEMDPISPRSHGPVVPHRLSRDANAPESDLNASMSHGHMFPHRLSRDISASDSGRPSDPAMIAPDPHALHRDLTVSAAPWNAEPHPLSSDQHLSQHAARTPADHLLSRDSSTQVAPAPPAVHEMRHDLVAPPLSVDASPHALQRDPVLLAQAAADHAHSLPDYAV